jgi:hypothetical protein
VHALERRVQKAFVRERSEKRRKKERKKERKKAGEIHVIELG